MDITKFTEMKNKIEELKKEMAKAAQKELIELYKEFFEKHENARALSWTQYTPYFNDGDSCVFGVNDLAVVLTEKSDLKNSEYEDDSFDLDDDEDVKAYCAWSLKDGELQQDLHDMSEAHVSMEESLESIFGDHVRVVVKRDLTISTEDYEHD